MGRDYLYSFRNLYLGQFRTAGKYISIFIAVRSVSTGAVYPVHRIIGTDKIAAASKDFIAQCGDAVWQMYVGDSGTVFKCIGSDRSKAGWQRDTLQAQTAAEGPGSDRGCFFGEADFL